MFEWFKNNRTKEVEAKLVLALEGFNKVIEEIEDKADKVGAENCTNTEINALSRARWAKSRIVRKGSNG